MSYYDTTGRPLRRIVVFVLAVTGSACLTATALAHRPTSHHASRTTANVTRTRTTSSAPSMIPGRLVVGFSDAQVNFHSGNVSGPNIVNPRGFEVDLAAAIAKSLNLTPKYVFAPWTNLFAPGHKSFDISFQEATITAQRKKTVDFTSSYFDANQGVLLSKTAKTPHSVADLKTMQTCAGTGTTGLAWIQQTLHPEQSPLVYPSAAAMFHAVQVGRCAALILDTPIVASEKKARPNAYGPLAGQIVTHEQYGGVLQKGSPLTRIIDKQIATLWANGTITMLQKKWFNIDFSTIPVLKNARHATGHSGEVKLSTNIGGGNSALAQAFGSGYVRSAP